MTCSFLDAKGNKLSPKRKTNKKKVTKKNLKEEKKNSFYMTSFEYLWALLEPKKEYEPVRNRCLLLWNTFTLEQQRRIYNTIRNRKKEHLFVDYNPLFAIQRFSKAPQKQTLSFNDYYVKFGTTEETDGWRRVFLPDKQTTIYVKN